jgi:hypothetical protein
MSELVGQFFEQDLGLEDIKLLSDLVERDEAVAQAMATQATEKLQSYQRGAPRWPAEVREPSLGRKAMSRLYIFFTAAAVGVAALVFFAWQLQPKNHEPHWSQPLEVQPVKVQRQESKSEKRPSRPAKPKAADAEQTQMGPVIEVHQAEAGDVVINVFTLDGQEVRKGLYSGELKEGVWKFPWDGLDRYSRKVKAGVYRVEVLRPDIKPQKFTMRLTEAHLKKM